MKNDPSKPCITVTGAEKGSADKTKVDENNNLETRASCDLSKEEVNNKILSFLVNIKIIFYVYLSLLKSLNSKLKKKI